MRPHDAMRMLGHQEIADQWDREDALFGKLALVTTISMAGTLIGACAHLPSILVGTMFIVFVVSITTLTVVVIRLER